MMSFVLIPNPCEVRFNPSVDSICGFSTKLFYEPLVSIAVVFAAIAATTQWYDVGSSVSGVINAPLGYWYPMVLFWIFTTHLTYSALSIKIFAAQIPLMLRHTCRKIRGAGATQVFMYRSSCFPFFGSLRSGFLMSRLSAFATQGIVTGRLALVAVECRIIHWLYLFTATTSLVARRNIRPNWARLHRMAHHTRATLNNQSIRSMLICMEIFKRGRKRAFAYTALLEAGQWDGCGRASKYRGFIFPAFPASCHKPAATFMEKLGRSRELSLALGASLGRRNRGIILDRHGANSTLSHSPTVISSAGAFRFPLSIPQIEVKS